MRVFDTDRELMKRIWPIIGWIRELVAGPPCRPLRQSSCELVLIVEERRKLEARRQFTTHKTNRGILLGEIIATEA